MVIVVYAPFHVIPSFDLFASRFFVSSSSFMRIFGAVCFAALIVEVNIKIVQSTRSARQFLIFHMRSHIRLVCESEFAYWILF